MLKNRTFTKPLEITRRKEQIDNDNEIRRIVRNEVKRLSPSFLKTIDKIKKSMREKKDPTNDSRGSTKSIDWRTVIDGSLSKSKEAVNHVDRINKPLLPVAVSKTVEEDNKGHR